MAREALTRLANADHDSGEGSDDPVAAAGVAAGIQAAARELGAALTVPPASVMRTRMPAARACTVT
jgi:hypothetical protein